MKRVRFKVARLCFFVVAFIMVSLLGVSAVFEKATIFTKLPLSTYQYGLAGLAGLASGSAVVPDWSNVEYPPFPVGQGDIPNPLITAHDVTDRSATSVGDPFLLHENGVFYMFMEVVVAPGVDAGDDIGLATSSDGFNWTYQRIVLDEPFHISYPVVFKWSERYYMTTENFGNNSVRIYEATDFPYGWTYLATLVHGRPFADPTIFRYDGSWWMFVSDVTSQNCYLYYSDNLTDPASWKEHPLSPIIRGDSSRARPGGRSGVYGKKILRFAQKCDVVYGEAVRAFEVDVLNSSSYAEHEVPESPLLAKSGSGWNKDGMHTFDPWWIGDRWLVAVDGREYTGSVDAVISIGVYVSAPHDVTSPDISNISRAPTLPNYDETVTVAATITDDVAVDRPILSYTFNFSWVNVTMVQQGGEYVAAIPSQLYGTGVRYKIYANDTSGNWATSEVYSYTVGDTEAPQILSIDALPTCPYPFVPSNITRANEPTLITANISEPAAASGMSAALFSYRADSGKWWNTSMDYNSTIDLWTTTIPGQSNTTNTIEFLVEAHDNAGNVATSPVQTFNVRALLAGDINGDGKIDMGDVGYIARRFMCRPGDSLWDPNADINSDGKIDMKDIGTVTRHFGEHYP